MELSKALIVIAVLLAGLGSGSASLFSTAGDGGQSSSSWDVGAHVDGGGRAELAVEQASHPQRKLVTLNSYISYGALRADNTNCPPMSGRSYYLPNCRAATGPVNPYERGCLTITRCVRDTS